MKIVSWSCQLKKPTLYVLALHALPAYITGLNSTQFPANCGNFSRPRATHQYVMTERLKLLRQLTAVGVKTISRVNTWATNFGLYETSHP